MNKNFSDCKKLLGIKEIAYKYAERLRETSVSLKTLMKDDEIELKEEVIRFLHKEAKNELLPQLEQHSNVIYLAMKKTGKWGYMGEERVTISHCRHILRIPEKRQVSDFDMKKMDKIIDALDIKLGCKSGEELIEYCIKRPVVLFGEPYSSFAKLQSFIKLLDAQYYLYSLSGPFCGEFIFGPIEYDSFGEICIYTFTREWVRSPSNILGIVARAPGVNNPMMQIRKEALECILYNKWMRFFDQSIYELKMAMEHPNSAIREGFKKVVLNFCGINSRKDITMTNSDILFDLLCMRDGVVYHELGHYLYSKYDRNPVEKAIYNTFREDDNVLCALEELLADWAPQSNTMKGAMLRFAELGIINSIKGSRLLYIYASDNWFPDEEFLVLRSHIMVGFTLAFVKDDMSFDYKSIISEQPAIYGFLVTRQKSILHKVREILYNTSYERGTKTFEEVEKVVIEVLRKKGTTDEIKEKYEYWEEIRDNYIKTDTVLEKLIEEQLKTQSNMLEHDVFNIIKGILKRRKIMKKYESLWDFIVSRCKEIGVLPERNIYSAIDSVYIDFDEYYMIEEEQVMELS